VKKILLGLFVLGSFSSFASNESCLKDKAEEAALAIEKINGHRSATAKMISSEVKNINTIATVETYSGLGGAVYYITLDGCKILSSKMSEEVDR
jgi:hypothetical protein